MLALAIGGAALVGIGAFLAVRHIGVAAALAAGTALVAVGEAERQRVIAAEQARCASLTKLHADAAYGHQDGEVNWWMPLTDIDETSTLWAESRPGAGDWYPFFPLRPGEAWRFPGTNCRHLTKANISGRTRVSIDFRVSVASCYDAEWSKEGDRARHEMRAVRCQ